MRPYSHYLTDLARQLRRRSTEAEEILWRRLRRHQLNGLHFARQHRFGRYIVDFYCGELKLVIEVEGRIHEKADQREYDDARFSDLSSRGLRILRIKNEDVLEDVEKVLQKVLDLRP